MVRRLVFALLLSSSACQRGIDWNRKDAYQHCAGAISGYPEAKAPPCQAMSMCLNEARLTPEEQAKLRSMLQDAGCAPP
jgi:hypothetical protein